MLSGKLLSRDLCSIHVRYEMGSQGATRTFLTTWLKWDNSGLQFSANLSNPNLCCLTGGTLVHRCFTAVLSGICHAERQASGHPRGDVQCLKCCESQKTRENINQDNNPQKDRNAHHQYFSRILPTSIFFGVDRTGNDAKNSCFESSEMSFRLGFAFCLSPGCWTSCRYQTT